MRRRRRDDEGAALEPEAPPATQRRLGPVDVQQKVFRLSFRGYNERDVDEFLDQVTESLAALHEENKRLRESLQDAGGAPAALAGAPAQAEEIVRQAREHAAKLVEDAERRAAEIRPSVPSTPAPTGELPASFLAKERDFLKRLAAMVQDHARSLKEDVARARPEGVAEADRPAAARANALAFAQRAVEEEEERRPDRAASSEPSPADVAAERMPAASERSEPPSPAPVATPAGPTATPAPPPLAPATGETRDAGAEPEESTPGPSMAGAQPEAASESDEPTGPWGPAAREPGNEPVPGLAGSDRADRRDADPLISAWESAFLGGGPETDADRGSAQAPAGSPQPTAEEAPEREEAREPEEKRAEEPSLKELFWGEQ